MIDDLTKRMTEYIVLHVLMHHRQQRRLDANQQPKNLGLLSHPCRIGLAVGIMGLGVMGQDSALRLRDLGFRVAGWSRSRESTFQALSALRALPSSMPSWRGPMCWSRLLPATAETDGIINRTTIRKLSRRGPFGAPIVINAGRGRQQVASDILACLDNGELLAATLDVFAVEPLPADDPLWAHPKCHRDAAYARRIPTRK